MKTQSIAFGAVHETAAVKQRGNNIEKKENSGLDFGNYLTSNLKSQNSSSDTMSANRKAVKADKQNNKNANPEVKEKEEVNPKNKTEISKSTKTEDSQNVEKPADDSLDLDEKAVKLIKQIKDIIENGLDLSEEAVNSILALLGMNFLDLLDKDNLQKFVLTANGETDSSAFLMNEDLSKTMQQILDSMEQISFEDLGITSEDLEKLKLQKPDNTFEQVRPAPLAENETSQSVKQAESSPVFSTKASESKEEPISLNGEKAVVTTENTKIKTEGQKTESDSGQNLQKQTEDPVFDSIINNISQSVQTDQNVEGMDFAQVKNIREIANQIIERIKITIKPDTTSMEMQLNPEHLGKVHLIVASKEGIMTAQFHVENNAAKEAIESQLQIFKESLNQQGLKVDAVEVSVSNFDLQKDSHMGNGTKEEKKRSSTKKINLDDWTGQNLNDDEALENGIQVEGNTVDYTA